MSNVINNMGNAPQGNLGLIAVNTRYESVDEGGGDNTKLPQPPEEDTGVTPTPDTGIKWTIVSWDAGMDNVTDESKYTVYETTEHLIEPDPRQANITVDEGVANIGEGVLTTAYYQLQPNDHIRIETDFLGYMGAFLWAHTGKGATMVGEPKSIHYPHSAYTGENSNIDPQRILVQKDLNQLIISDNDPYEQTMKFSEIYDYMFQQDELFYIDYIHQGDSVIIDINGLMSFTAESVEFDTITIPLGSNATTSPVPGGAIWFKSYKLEPGAPRLTAPSSFTIVEPEL